MLTKEMKREVFLKLRTENYRASLRLDGLPPHPDGLSKPVMEATAVKSKRKTKTVR